MTLKNQINEFISFANILADESAKVIMKYFRQTFTIENKDDNTPVTIADKKSELKIRELINNSYPNHGILAEEFDNTKLDSEYIWVIDPIDGTRSFIAGHKDFGTLIALLYKKKPILGIINCPAHDERWIGIENQITTLNGKKINYFPSSLEDQLKVKPTYKRFDGWLKSTKGINKWKELPKNAQKYIVFIKNFCGVNISSISTSPKREDTILLENPFKRFK